MMVSSSERAALISSSNRASGSLPKTSGDPSPRENNTDFGMFESPREGNSFESPRMSFSLDASLNVSPRRTSSFDSVSPKKSPDVESPRCYFESPSNMSPLSPRSAEESDSKLVEEEKDEFFSSPALNSNEKESALMYNSLLRKADGGEEECGYLESANPVRSSAMLPANLHNHSPRVNSFENFHVWATEIFVVFVKTLLFLR